MNQTFSWPGCAKISGKIDLEPTVGARAWRQAWGVQPLDRPGASPSTPQQRTAERTDPDLRSGSQEAEIIPPRDAQKKAAEERIAQEETAAEERAEAERVERTEQEKAVADK
jgi:hypothetical protein